MSKCPVCGGSLAGTPPSAKNPKIVDSDLAQLRNTVRNRLDEPVELYSVLMQYPKIGNYYRFEPVNRLVVRTHFRAKDVLEMLDLSLSPQTLGVALRGLPGWTPPTEYRWVFSTQGWFWVRSGYSHYPGFIDADDFEEDLI